MDQREWDYGSRLPRDNRAPEDWSATSSPESPEKSGSWGTGSVADTGSLQPIPEAVEWAERAEAWAQRPANGDGQVEVSRWSSVEPTGRPNFPAEGVGWRTETAEWRATEQTARWRQTTEWRSASGTHGWRSTTEAWHTGAGAENLLPPSDPPARQQLAISGTAWPTPGSEAGTDALPGEIRESGPAWQPADGTAGQGGATGGATWQRFTDGTPPWEATNGTPPWEATNGTPPWEATNGTAPWESRNGTAAPPWETGGGTAARPWENGNGNGTAPPRSETTAPPWEPGNSTQARPWETETGTTGRPWETGNGTPAPPWQAGNGTPAPPWQAGNGTPAPPWETGNGTRGGASDGRPAWQQFTAPADGPTPGGTAAAPSPWTTGAVPDRPESSWQQLVDPTRSRSEPAPPETGPRRTERPGWQAFTEPDDGRHLVREDDRARWRRDTATGPGEGTRQVGRRRAAEPGSRTSGGTGWSTRSDTDNWAGHTDTGSIQMFDDGGARTEAPNWRDAPREDDGRRADRAPRSGGDWRTRTDGWRAEPDSGSWSRGDEPQTDSWRQSSPAAGWAGDREAPGWLRDEREASDAPGEATGRRARRREIEPPADPWAQTASDTGVIPMAWQQPETDTGSWRTDTGTGFTRPTNPNRRRDDADPRNGRRRDDTETRGGRRRAAPEDEAAWRRDSEAGSVRGNWPAEEDARRNRWADEGPGGGPLAIEGPGRDDPPRRGRWAEDEDDRRGTPRAAGWSGDDQRPGRWDAEPREIEPPRPAWSGDDQRPGRWDAEPREIEPPRSAWSGPAGSDDWRRDLRDGPAPGDAVTEVRPPVDPETWRRPDAGPPARGTARYRTAGTDDWRRELAAESSDLADGESRRFGTQEFVPFRPSGSAAVPTSAPVAEPPADRPVNGSRQELLVGNPDAGRTAEPPEGQWPPRQPTGYQSPAPGGAYERRPVGTNLTDAPGRPSNLLEPDDDDDLEEDTGGPLAAVGYTVMWYGVPVVLVVLYMLVLNGSQQARALDTLGGAAPEFGLSLLLSVVVAVGLRWASGTWKAASVGLAAAVVGGGLATVLSSAITGNSLS
ncbi:hypothetical protein [Jidongwangia harbinensis]|uniref:hypothetical protein n=1 Tax=Jidongwangia harbinensis TaxID=2878561 RepID=UPI001CD9CFF7|nr:hypothetical protein [Jidongwangia harbinensis]MCA2212703.1 hypothetical protein [Jidongwangia harbinensis]